MGSRDIIPMDYVVAVGIFSDVDNAARIEGISAGNIGRVRR